MKLDRYELKAEKSLIVFEFISKGSKGQILKIIKFSRTEIKNQYNIAFGDKTRNDFDDKIVSNNGDSIKILATVIEAIREFTNKYQRRTVYFRGSTKGRTRLYRMGLTKYLAELKTDFIIYGLTNDRWEEFKKDIEYDAYLLKRKN